MKNPAGQKTSPSGDRAIADMPVQLREAQLVPTSFNEADRTVDVVWTTGARRRAYDWYNDTPYEEELAVDDDSVDMTRFDAGTVQVLDAHRMYGGVGAILGIAIRGSIENGQGLATIRLSGNPDNAGIVQDIKDGIIRAVSFGYSVQQYQITRAQDRTDGINMPLYRAVKWTPQEISFVPVPADPDASTRSRSQPSRGTPCEFIRAAAHSPKDPTMTEAELQAQRDQEAAAQRAATEKAAADAATAERARATDITDLCTRHAVPGDKMRGYIADATMTVDKVRAAILDDLATRAGGGGGNVNVQTVQDETKTRLAGLEEAFQHRVDAGFKITENGMRFRGMTLLEMGREHLERCNINTRGMTRLQLATAMLQHRSGALSTSDFPALLANVANKRLRQAYEQNPPSYQRWARKAPDAPDFKAMTVINLAGTPDLLQVNEHGEFTYGAMTDGKETYSLITYGRIVSLTRQALINDDLRGFDRLVGAFGASAARLENRTVYSILTANAAMSDGTALFAAGHGNLAGAGAAIAVAPLTAGRAAMRTQKGLQNNELNIVPSFLIVPAAQEQVAYQYTSANYVPTQQANVSEFRAGGRTALEPVVEAVLDASSSLSWYLAADSSQVDTVEYCYLEGAPGPVIESEIGFEVDGISYKCREDFAAKAIDWRGLYKNPGA